MKKLKQKIGYIIGSITAVIVLVDFALVMTLACIMLVRLVFSF